MPGLHLHLARWLLLAALLVPPTAATYDLVERFYQHDRNGEHAAQLQLPIDRVPSSVTDRLARYELQWSSISGLLQRAVLWDTGFVLTSPTTVAQIYVEGRRTMAEIQLDITAVHNHTKSDSLCDSSAHCSAYNYYLRESCPPALLAPFTRCAVKLSAANAAEYQPGTYWAEDGDDIRLTEPILRRHTRDGTSMDAALFAIHLQETAFTECDLLGFFIVPCRVIDEDDQLLSIPTNGMAAEAWMRAVSSTTKTFSTTATIVISVLLATVVALVGVVLAQYRSRRQLKAAFTSSAITPLISVDPFDPRKEGGMDDDDDDASETNHALTARSAILRRFVSDPAIITKRIAFSQITILRVLAKGASGEVWLGQFESQYVALKCLLPIKRQQIAALEMFSEEIRLASVLDHPRIVQFCGIAWHALASLSIVTEYMERGDMEAFLAQPAAKQLTWAREKLVFARDVAEALVYLHSLAPVVVHRDLKSKNIMLDTQMHAKLSDFGLSRETSSNDTMTNGVGTLLWSAPEVLEGKQYNEKADIFSYGIVLSEIDTCALPYGFSKDGNRSKMKSMQIVHLVSEGQLLPTFLDDSPKEVVALARQCLELDPAKRPSALQIVHTLRSQIFPLLNNGMTCSS